MSGHRADPHSFTVVARDASGSHARLGYMETGHGTVETPCFFPVGTAGTVKTLTPDELLDAGTQAILSNTYHLYLRPGTEILEKAGGLHRFMRWPRPILTDSGGYQVFSMTDLKKVRDDGVEFQSHLDGSYHVFTPEKVVAVQRSIGSDMMMVLDLCAPYPCSHAQAKQWHEITVRWAAAAHEAEERLPHLYGHSQNLWAIMQGSVFPDLRRASAEALIELDFSGYAIGGLAVGEPKTVFREMVEFSAPLLPDHKSRYLMGVGFPEDLLFSIAQGVDFFDCVLPTRNGRNGTAFTWHGKLIVKAAREKEHFIPIDENCGCFTCRNFDRAYIRHLFVAEEILALRLVSLHNVYFYQELMRTARDHIQAGDYRIWMDHLLSEWQSSESLITEAQ
ncbi:tRNA guanosine(34) transglycosylase Tgt [candidate division KSB1 bacterium]|nr:MAG: tRNA guanosine(34) transglycosylase Tgt [candidate division KSB1 bacterium]